MTVESLGHMDIFCILENYDKKVIVQHTLNNHILQYQHRIKAFGYSSIHQN